MRERTFCTGQSSDVISVAFSLSTVEALKEKGVTSSILPGSTSDSCINTAKGKKKNSLVHRL